MHSKTMANSLTSRDNSLNALRLVLALLVIVSHAPLIAGVGLPYSWSDLEVGGWAVAGFFAISGWLISGSRMNLAMAPFMWRRCLRILPAFWVILLVTAFLFAPLSTVAEGSSYDPRSAVTYFLKNCALWIFQPGIKGTLVTNPDHVWNLSLWTLSWEMLCYIAVGTLLTFKVVRSKPSIVVTIFLLFTVANTVVRVTEVVPTGSALGAALRLGSFFLAGVVLRMLADKVPVSSLLAIGAAVVVVVLTLFGYVGSLGALPLAYLCLYGGVRLPLARVGARNDISYGIYVFGYPIGQLIVVFGGAQLPILWFIALNCLLVIPFAWASWLFVEKPALRLKDLVRSDRRARAPAPVG